VEAVGYAGGGSWAVAAAFEGAGDSPCVLSLECSLNSRSSLRFWMSSI